MKELKIIIDVYDQLQKTGKNGALATVVKVEGSSYRRAGARMLMTEDGHWTGAISGGCLEGDALRRSRKVMHEGKPAVVTYDTMNDESAASLGVGLGCNGIIDVLLEPLHLDKPNNPIEILRNFVKERKPTVLATVFGADENTQIQVGERMMLQHDNSVLNFIENQELSFKVQSIIHQILVNGKSETQIFDLANGQATVFMEVLHPSIELVIFGSGYDAIPVVKLASELGWHITVTDDCAAKVVPNRYPQAQRIELIQRGDILDKIQISPYTAAVLMSHNYKYDIGILEQLLKSDIRYIGLLGPKKRYVKMQEELNNKGIYFDTNKVNSPIGLDLGAETPDEIALSIIGEIQASFQGRKGSFLKDKDGFIHDRAAHPLEKV